MRSPRPKAPLHLTEFDIWKMALLMLRRYGADAAVATAKRADEFLDAGDQDGWVVWYRIVHAIQRLLAEEPSKGEAVH
jgi:hypothetical protein